MEVVLKYFKTSGKYYTTGTYNSAYTSMLDIWLEVASLQKLGNLPGLVNGAKEFMILIEVPEHPHNHPRLLLAMGE